MADIRTGSVVKLRSGGPAMTVGQVVNSLYVCQWFDGTELKSGHVHRDALAPADAGQAPGAPR